MNESPFDVVIVDEAAQAVEPSVWLPIMKGKKLILAGDHLQLPPTIKSLNDHGKESKKSKSISTSTSKSKPNGTSSLEKERKSDDLVSTLSDMTISTSAPPPSSKLRQSSTLELTLFQRLLTLHGYSIRRMLSVQYRMNSKIMEYPSKSLYDDELVADESVKARVLSDLEGVEPDEEIDEPVVFIDSKSSPWCGRFSIDLDIDSLLHSSMALAAGSAMYERLADPSNSSLDADSKSNENEASLVVKHVASLVRHRIPTLHVIVEYQLTLISMTDQSQRSSLFNRCHLTL